MRSSGCQTTTTGYGGNNGSSGVSTSSYSSKSSSSSSSSSFHPPPSITTTITTSTSLLHTPRRTMEEVWKDISFTSLQDHPQRSEQLSGLLSKNNAHHPHGRATLGGINLQDFLARPFNKDPPTTAGSSTTSGGDFGGFASSAPPPPPPTVLCLNSGPEFHYMDNGDHPFGSHHGQLENQHHNDVGSTLVATLNNSPFDAFGASSALSPFCRKRGGPECKENSGDRRHKRMIKNRESAARSRARKQESISPDLLYPFTSLSSVCLYISFS